MIGIREIDGQINRKRENEKERDSYGSFVKKFTC